MGYATTFTGKLKLNKAAPPEVVNAFALLRNNTPERIASKNATFYTTSFCWQLSPDHNYITWDGSEKCYYYVEWLKYVIEKILKPHNLILNGTLLAIGEAPIDESTITANDNTISVHKLTKAEQRTRVQKENNITKKLIGTILTQSNATIIKLHKRSIKTITDIYKRTIISPRLKDHVLLIKEKTDDYNLYLLEEDETQPEPNSSTILSYKAMNKYIPLTTITKVVHFNSIIWRTILNTPNAYRLKAVISGKTKNYIIQLKDPTILVELHNYAICNKKQVSSKSSNDVHLIYYLIKKLLLGIIIGLLTFFTLQMTIISWDLLVLNYPIKSIIVFVTTLVIYYLLVFKVLWPSLRIVYLPSLFKLKYY